MKKNVIQFSKWSNSQMLILVYLGVFTYMTFGFAQDCIFDNASFDFCKY